MQNPEFKLQIAELHLKAQAAQNQHDKDMAELELKKQELAIKDRDSQITAGAKAAEIHVQTAQLQHSQAMDMCSMDHMDMKGMKDTAEPNDTMAAIKMLAESMAGAQTVMEKMLEQLQSDAKADSDRLMEKMVESTKATKMVQIKKQPDGSFVGISEVKE